MKYLSILCAALFAVAMVSCAAEEQIAAGVYFNAGKYYCPADEEAFSQLKSQTGRLAKLYMNFQSWTEEYNTFSTRLANNAGAHGGVFMVVWMPGGGEDKASDANWSCAAITSGAKDAYIKQYAADVKKWGHPVMLRLAHEMNGAWYSYGTSFDKNGVRHNSNKPSDYAAMWRHIWDIFKQAGAENVYWVWSPNIFVVNERNTLASQQADLVELYPGDAYVDWIGLDGYNDGVKSKWRTFPELFDCSYRAITALTPKPLMIAEFGCSEIGAPAGTSKAAWITQTYLTDIPQQYPRIKLVNWFSRDKTKQGETDWRFNSSPEAQAAYSAAVNTALYQGSITLEHK